MIDPNHKYGIGPAGRWMIFSGVAAVLIALFTCIAPALERTVGQNALLAIFFGGVALLFLTLLHLFKRCPTRILITVGILGWLLSFLVMYLRD
jgi:hypothetical protein